MEANLLISMTIEICAFIVSGVICFFLMLQRRRNKLDRAIFRLVMLNAAVLVCDIIATYADGKGGDLFKWMNHGGNFLVYFINYLTIFSYGSCLRAYLGEVTGAQKRLFFVVKLATIATIVMLIASQQHHFLYYFDEANRYHRGNFFMLAQVAAVVATVTYVRMLAVNMRKLLPNELFALSVYLVLPFFATIFQTFVYGYPAQTVASTMGCWGLFFAREIAMGNELSAALEEEERKNILITRQKHIVDYFVASYSSAYYVDLARETFEILHIKQGIVEHFDQDGTRESMAAFVDKYVHPKDREDIRKIIDREYVRSVLSDRDEFTFSLRELINGETRNMRGVIARGLDEYHVIVGFIDITDELRIEREKQEQLDQVKAVNLEQYQVLTCIADQFNSMHIINLTNDTVKEFKAQQMVREYVNSSTDARRMMVNVMTATTSEEYREVMLSFTDLDTVAERMMKLSTIAEEFINCHDRWYRAQFTVIERDETGRAVRVLFTTQNVNGDKRQRERLIRESQTDRLTGLYNRRGYEADIARYATQPMEDDMVYISMDVNGLKTTNDKFGHIVGDKMLVAAANIMKKCFGGYGRIYRMGGDEFVFIGEMSDEQREQALKEFTQLTQNWSGGAVNGIVVPCGVVSKKEVPEATFRDIAELADHRMYDAKREWYRNKGTGVFRSRLHMEE